MSIYSGFATRFQEQSYDHCIDALLYVLQKRIIKFYMGELADEEKFISVVMRLHHQMQKMEKNKYLEPKSSESVRQLAHFMQVYQHNFAQPGQQITSIQPETEAEPSNESASVPTQVNTDKKKISYWVLKVPKEQESQPEEQKQAEVLEPSINDKPTESSCQKPMAQFKRTTFHNRSIRGVKLKNSSRSNLSRQKVQDGQMELLKIQKSRATSHYLQNKPPLVSSKLTSNEGSLHDGSSARLSRRFSNSKGAGCGLVPGEIKPVASRNEVSDIIKDYIIQSKRSKKLRGRSRDNTEFYGRLNDF